MNGRGDQSVCDFCWRTHGRLPVDAALNNYERSRLHLDAAHVYERQRAIELLKVQARAAAEREGVMVACLDRIAIACEQRIVNAREIDRVVARIEAAMARLASAPPPEDPPADLARGSAAGDPSDERQLIDGILYRLMSECASGHHGGNCPRGVIGADGRRIVESVCTCCCHDNSGVPDSAIYHDYDAAGARICSHRGDQATR